MRFEVAINSMSSSRGKMGFLLIRRRKGIKDRRTAATTRYLKAQLGEKGEYTIDVVAIVTNSPAMMTSILKVPAGLLPQKLLTHYPALLHLYLHHL